MSVPMLTTFLAYVLGMLVIGLIAYRRTRNFSDYILGSRRLGSLVTALAAGASDMSGWLLMGLPGAIFLFGISESWIAVGLAIGAYCNWKWVAGRLRVHTEINGNALTLPDYFNNRFEDAGNVLRVISTLVILMFFTVYCASGAVAGVRLFESAFDVDYGTALWIGIAATVGYTFIGGFLAVSWTDSVQASLMLFALILVPVMAILAAGGAEEAVQIIAAASPERLDVLKGLDGVAILSLLGWGLGWGLGYFGQPHILTRFMAASSHRAIHSARRISMTWMILCLSGSVAVGFFGFSYFSLHPDQAGGVSANGERIFIELAMLLFNPWMAGVLLSAILAAVMSTLSCQLIVCSSAITEDAYKVFLRPRASQRELVLAGRGLVLAVALAAVALAADPENRVLALVSYAWAGFGAAFGPVVLISVLWPRMTRNGALAGMLTGAATAVVWKQYAWLGIYEIIPGFLAGSIAVVVASLLGPPATATMIERFDKAEAEFDGA